MVNVKFGGSCKSLVLLEVVDGGEGTLVWHKEGSKRGEGFFRACALEPT